MRQTRCVDKAGRSELHYCALQGDVERIRQRIASGDPVSGADKAGFTPLHFAAQQSDAGAAAALLEAGAAVDAKDGFGNTPLWRAVFNSRGHGATVRVLLEAGADPDEPNDSGVSPRGLAAKMANFDVARFFDADS